MDDASTLFTDNIVKLNVTREHGCDNFNEVKPIIDKNGRNGIVIPKKTTLRWMYVRSSGPVAVSKIWQ